MPAARSVMDWSTAALMQCGGRKGYMTVTWGYVAPNIGDRPLHAAIAGSAAITGTIRALEGCNQRPDRALASAMSSTSRWPGLTLASLFVVELLNSRLPRTAQITKVVIVDGSQAVP